MLFTYWECQKNTRLAKETYALRYPNKDLKERSVIKSLFPTSRLVICLFHTLRTFNREITCEKLGITPDERDSSKKFIEQLCYCKNEKEYQEIHTIFLSQAPHQVQMYFEKNWHDIREEWVTGLTFQSGNFLNTTNNRLESFNSKLKSVIPFFSNLSEFFKQLFVVIKCVRSERDSKTINLVQKLPTKKIENSDEYKYSMLLTPYAFNYLKKGLSCTNKTKILEGTSLTSCSCAFYNSMKLPCKHIFNKRRATNHSLYDEDICDKRWTRNYYYKSQVIFKEPLKLCEAVREVPIEIQEKKNTRLLSANEKFRKASVKASKLAELLSISSQFNYERRMNQLEQIIKNVNQPSTSSGPDKNPTTNKFKVADIKLPTKIKCSGRPKGATQTTIGLPIRKKQIKPIPYNAHNYLHKENLIIEWLTNKTVVNKVRKDKYLIQSKDIKHYSDVFNGIIENEVDINTVKSYCSNDAWKKIIAVLKQKKKNITWCRKKEKESIRPNRGTHNLYE
ncbi:hypothetical protein ACI65C_004562 [Semiaphis heraclei]